MGASEWFERVMGTKAGTVETYFVKKFAKEACPP